MRYFKGNIKYFNRKQQMQYNSKKEYGEEYFLLEIKKKKNPNCVSLHKYWLNLPNEL